MTVFGGKSVKNAPNMAFFGALRANKMSFEIHLTTIPTGSLSFGMKNR